jgi:hypothetical protein
MTIRTVLLCATLSFATFCPSEAQRSERDGQAGPRSQLDTTIGRFDVSGSILRDGVSELSLKNIDGLHLGFEEVIRERIQQDPRALSPHFTIHLEGKTVREILDELCKADSRYTWSQDGATVNIYPRAAVEGSAYLLNLRIDKIVLNDVPDPDQALAPLSKQFPEQQVGYFGAGLGNNTYAEPWTRVFDSLTVRQFINRIAEHMGPRTSWVWEGGEKERMFTFLKGGFNTSRAIQRK